VRGDAEKAAVGFVPALILLIKVRVETQPSAVSVVSDMVNLPEEKLCAGFCWVEMVLSPKFQSQLLMLTPAVLDVSVNCTLNEAQPESTSVINPVLGVKNTFM
jgi:hypothetical protein